MIFSIIQNSIFSRFVPLVQWTHVFIPVNHSLDCNQGEGGRQLIQSEHGGLETSLLLWFPKKLIINE